MVSIHKFLCLCDVCVTLPFSFSKKVIKMVKETEFGVTITVTLKSRKRHINLKVNVIKPL